MKTTTCCSMIATPIIISFFYFGGLELLAGDKALAKGMVLSFIADVFCLIAMSAYLFKRRRLSEEDEKKIIFLLRISGCVTLVILLSVTAVFYTETSFLIELGAGFISLASFSNLFFLLKNMGGNMNISSTKFHGLEPNNLNFDDSQPLVNPANGLPMIGGVSGMDVEGNSWGTNYNER
ncbi:hypothetical protein N7922_24705 (plasmid) [Kosakonia sp. ML.JS2a]|uniref:hypothetical protein n=1 Tax=Kosakonia sp. ML.JS2a TaxID=2980557 RepID=UPI0021DB106C|nr:hypothetical protein [Kosakonia sp. ML.JS2a]UXY13555.1 hypothetical protein N7922_24705 [Kosakonia sp. ML.JS2a]